MSDAHLLDDVPVWAFFLFVALITLLTIEVGQRLGARRRQLAEHEPEGPVGSVVGATLALLGFMVALTLGAATSRFDARKEAVIDAVNAIETSYRNASLLPEPHKSEVRALLRDYVSVRLEMPRHYAEPEQLTTLDARARALQRSMWSHAEALAVADRSSEIHSLFTASLNDAAEIYSKRVILGAQYRIPLGLWVVLMIVTVVTMSGVGFHFGLVGRRSVIADLMLAFTFALVIAFIFDLDQPGKGLIHVDQQPMHDLYERMQAER